MNIDIIRQNYKEITDLIKNKMVIFAQKEDQVLVCFTIKDLEDITQKSNELNEYLRSLKKD